MAKYTAAQLCDFALQMVGQPYWFGTCVNKCDLGLYKRKKGQYPDALTYDSDHYNKCMSDIAANKVCADCVGLIKGFFWTNGGTGVIESIGTTNTFSNKYASNDMPDKGADSIMTWCSGKGAEVGTMDSFPFVPGVLVHFDGHVGIYVGDNYVVEARSTDKGIVKTNVLKRPWTDWAYLPSSHIDYSETSTPLEEGMYLSKVSKLRYYATVERFDEAKRTHNGLVIAKILMDYGWTANAVAGILGNIQSESGCNPHAYYGYQEYSATSFGLVQWDPTSKYEAWADENGYTPYYDIEYQCMRIIYEFENSLQYYATDSYPISPSEFVASKADPYDLACAFAWNYERSATVLNGTEEEKEALRQQRGGQARVWYNLIKDGVSEDDFEGGGIRPERHLSKLLLFAVASDIV